MIQRHGFHLGDCFLGLGGLHPGPECPAQPVLVEGPENGFTSMPMGVDWVIATLTTVGSGELAPKTGIGRFIASLQTLLGWGSLAVPTGIVSAEFTAQRVRREPTTPMACWSFGSSVPHT